MPVFKNEENGTWYVMARYVNWKGERKQKCKRGFATKKEAQEWERMFQLQTASDLDMSFGVLSKRVKNYDKAIEELNHLEDTIDSLPQYQLPDPQGLMSAKSYKKNVAEPLVKKLKSLIKTVMARCYEGWDNYHRLNTTNKNLHKNNERLMFHNKQLTADNNRLKEEVKDYKLLRKVFGHKQIDSLLEQARQSKQRGTRFRNKDYER